MIFKERFDFSLQFTARTEEDVQSRVTVQLIVAVLNGFARPVGGRPITNQNLARHFSRPLG